MTVAAFAVPALHHGAPSPGLPPYYLQRSLLFYKPALTFMNRSAPLVLPTDNKKWTLSWWYSDANSGAYAPIFVAGQDQTNLSLTAINGNGQIDHYLLTANAVTYRIAGATNVAALGWCHIMLVFDSANAVAADRLQLWVNGVREVPSSYTAPTLSVMSYWNNGGYTEYIGVAFSADPIYGGYLTAYMTEINMVDGQVVPVASFGHTYQTKWVPSKYAGTYGLAGWRLNYSNATSAANLGLDSSGLNHNFTMANFDPLYGHLLTPSNTLQNDVYNGGAKSVSQHTYLQRMVPTNGNLRNWTYSIWLYRYDGAGAQQFIVEGYLNPQNYFYLEFTGDGRLAVGQYEGNVLTFNLLSVPAIGIDGLYHHIVMSADTTNVNAADRIKLFIDGVRCATTGSSPAQSQQLYLNLGTGQVLHGVSHVPSYYLGALMSQIYCIDGITYPPTLFAFNNTAGAVPRWEPIRYDATYQGQSWFYNFYPDSLFGTDKSGLGNNASAVNFTFPTYSTFITVPNTANQP